jgi:RHS repeat-associated protein
MPSACFYRVRLFSGEFLSTTAPALLNGNRTIQFNFNFDYSSPRVAFATIGGRLVMFSLMSNTGVECSYTLSSDRLSFYPVGGSSGSALTVSPSPVANCPWAAIFAADWVTVDDPTIHVGAGPLSITVPPNPTTNIRDAYGYVGNVKDVHIEQFGDHQCTTMRVSPLLFPDVPANGTSLVAGVRFADGIGNGCGWAVHNLNPDMLQVTLPSGNPAGDGDFTIQVFGNGVPGGRTGELLVYKPGYSSFTIVVEQCGTTGCTPDDGLPPPNGLDPGGMMSYYHTDAIGSVRMVTDANQAELARYDYLPFGEPNDAASHPSTLKFAGKERDLELTFGGQHFLDYFGGRYYQSQIGRFTSADPVFDIGLTLVNPQRWNRYVYVMNRPLVLTDPDGRCPMCIWQRIGQVATNVINRYGPPLYNWATRFFNSPAAQETAELVGEAFGLTGNVGRLSTWEKQTGVRLAKQMGEVLEVSEHLGAEFVTAVSRKTIDAMGTPQAYGRFWNWDQFALSIRKHLTKSNDHTVIDLTGANQDQISQIKAYVESLGPNAREHFLYVSD